MAEQVELELRWDPAPGDWADAIKTMAPMYRLAPWFGLAMAAFSVVVLVSGNRYAGIFGLFCAVLFAALPTLTTLVMFRRNPVAGTTLTAKVDERSIRMMTIDGTAYSDLDLRKLAGWQETRGGIMLRTDEHRGSPVHPIPNRAFQRPEDRDRFVALLERQLGPAGDGR